MSGCAVALEKNPAVVEWMNARGHDLLGHGLRWLEYSTASREEEERHIREAVALYTKVTGQRPMGWNTRSYPSINTRDLVVQEGGFLLINSGASATGITVSAALIFMARSLVTD